ncbi:hypothetical protein Hanom_Chr03g00218961 [Helianthus anomalus]
MAIKVKPQGARFKKFEIWTKMAKVPKPQGPNWQFTHSKKGVFEFWTKMAIKVKPQGPRFKKFEIWTKMAKVPKPQGPKWQFTLIIIQIK